MAYLFLGVLIIGILTLIKSVANDFTGKQVSKYIPIVGQAVAACAGYALIQYFGKNYVEDCYDMARALMEKIIDNEKRSK